MSDSGQLQPDDTLDDRGVDDILDEGISPPERLRGSDAVGVTPYEEEIGETLEERIAQEEPEVVPDPERVEEGFVDGYDDEETLDQEQADPEDVIAGDDRSGRLVAADEGWYDGTEDDLLGRDVGIDGAAASAEEAAMHEI